MKKQNLLKKLKFKKTVVSSLGSKQVVGGTGSFRRDCGPVDLSQIESCYVQCNYTDTCTTGGGTGGTTGNTGGTTGNESGGISCPGYVC